MGDADGFLVILRLLLIGPRTWFTKTTWCALHSGAHSPMPRSCQYCTILHSPTVRPYPCRDLYRAFPRSLKSPSESSSLYRQRVIRAAESRSGACDTATKHATKQTKHATKQATKRAESRRCNEQIGARTLALFAVWLLGGNARKLRGCRETESPSRRAKGSLGPDAGSAPEGCARGPAICMRIWILNVIMLG